MHYKSDIYSGSPNPRLNIARFDIIPRFIFVHGGFKLMFLNNCSFFFIFLLFIMATVVLWQEDGSGWEVGLGWGDG